VLRYGIVTTTTPLRGRGKADGGVGLLRRIQSVEHPHALQHLLTGIFDAAPEKVAGEAFQQTGAVASAIPAALLGLDEVGADQPVAQEQMAVDRPSDPSNAPGGQTVRASGGSLRSALMAAVRGVP